MPPAAVAVRFKKANTKAERKARQAHLRRLLNNNYRDTKRTASEIRGRFCVRTRRIFLRRFTRLARVRATLQSARRLVLRL